MEGCESMSDASYTQVTGKLDCNKCVWGTRDGGCASWECEFIDRDDAVKAWRNMPSAEPERKKGKWVGKERFVNSPEFYSWQCSVCGCVLEDPTLDKPYPFCPNCGADMRGEQE